MKKTGLLNQPLSSVIAGLGHTDTLVVADAGLPIPAGVTRIDLALTAGIPSFLEVLKAVAAEMKVEQITLAEEARRVSPQLEGLVRDVFPGVMIEFIPHAEFKARTARAAAVVRSGEFTPYFNAILASGVIF